MRLVSLAFLSALTACSAKGTTTLGGCPDGTADDGDGNCIEVDAEDTPNEGGNGTTDQADEEDENDTGASIDEEDTAVPDTDILCDFSISETKPINGDNDISWWSDVTFFISDDSLVEANISVSNTEGDVVEGTTSIIENAVIWTAEIGLDPDTIYSANIDGCEDDRAIEFTTASINDPLETDVSGDTFALDLSTATWVKPAGIGALLGGGLDMSILVGVEDASDTVDFIIAIPEAETIEQDYCLPTIDFDPIDFSYSPHFRIGPVDMPLTLMDYLVVIYSVDISGIFVSDGTGMEDVQLAGAIDLRDLKELLEELLSSTPDTACLLLGSFGVTCDACPSDGEELCIDVELVNIVATSTGTTIDVVETADTHPECEGGTDEPPEL